MKATIMRASHVPILILFLQFTTLHAVSQAQESRSGSLTALDVLQQAFAGEEQGPIKCGTGALLEWRKQEAASKSARILERPTLSDEYVTSDGLFRIHFTTTGGHAVDPTSTNGFGIPDYVYEVGLAASYSYRLLVDTLGYRAAASDRGADGQEFDIYILDHPRGLYGLTYADEPVPGSANRYSSYCVIDNEFRSDEGYYTVGLDAMRVTVAHEYFHGVQFNYSTPKNEDIFFYETSSVWFEDVAYDDVDDYLGYLSDYFLQTAKPLYLRFMYGNGIWLTYLVKRFDVQIAREFWEAIETNTALLSMSEVLTQRGQTLSAAYSEFTIWLYFTGPRADPVRYFPEGAGYPLIRFDRRQILQSSISLTDSLPSLASRFYRFDSLKQELTVSHNTDTQPGRWRFATITGNQQADYDVQESSSGIPLAVRAAGRVDTLAVIVSNSSLSTLQYFFKYSLQISSGSMAGDSRLLPPGPNPFLPSSGENLILRVTLDSNSEVEVFVLAEDGRKVRHINRGFRGAGVDEIPWDGRNDDGEIVASGIYIVQVIAGGFQEAAKVAVIHR